MTESTVAPPSPEKEVASTSPADSTAIMPQQSKTLAKYTDDDDSEGEFNQDDINRPMMVIVAKTGALSDLFTPGDLLLNKEFVIGGLKSPIELVPVTMKKRYQNDLDIDGGEMGEVVDKAIQVVDKGGIVGYRPYEDKDASHFWKPILQAVFLIKNPGGLPPEASSLFPFEIDGVEYALVGYSARAKSAYNGIAKSLIQIKSAKGNVRGTTFRLSTKGESWENKSWIQPSLRAIGATSEPVAKFIAENCV